MQIIVRHSTTITLGDGLPRTVQHLLLTPQSSSVQTVRDWRIDAPGMDDAVGFIDAYGNRAHLSSQTRPEATLVVTATGTIETHDTSGVVGRLERDPVHALFRRVTPLTKPVGAITSKLRAAPRDGKERIAFLHGLMARVAEVLGEAQSQSQSQDGQTQSQSAGAAASAADHAHAFVGAARAMTIPARYVTGYLAPGGEDGLSGLHAWAEAWDDGLGWIGFDAVLGICPEERHVRLASGLDSASVPPVRSVPAGTAHESEAEVELQT
jgi:transglutaminase-like putative cysteine protease